MKPRRIYLDYAGATPLDKRVRKAMAPFFADEFGNPSSVHAEGRAAKAAIETARRDAAAVIGAQPEEIIFTSGATESINLAIRGIVSSAPATHRHVVSVATEHKGVLRSLEESGYEVTLVPVDGMGLVSADVVLAAIRPDTALVTVMYVNNEIGTIAPLAEIGVGIEKLRRGTKSIYPVFHTDAAQAASYLTLDVGKLHVDAMSLSGAKIYGPKGNGMLYVKKGVPLTSLIVGGAQERGHRAGTENVPAIVGFAKALQLAQAEKAALAAQLLPLRDMLCEGILRAIPGTIVNGSLRERIPSNVNVTLPAVDGEAVIMYLDERGIAAATASSCTSSASMSHVIRALGRNDAEVEGSVRFTLGRATTKRDIKTVLAELPRIVSLLRLS